MAKRFCKFCGLPDYAIRGLTDTCEHQMVAAPTPQARGASEPSTDPAWPTQYDPVWATVLIEPESMEPREASRQEYELLSETGIAVERMLIQPAGSPVPSIEPVVNDEGAA